jgi:hypothetical protein
MKNVNHWRKKLKNTSEDGKISHAYISAESILWNGCTTIRNLYVQSNPHDNSSDILHRDWKVNPKVHMEAQKTSNRQSNPEKCLTSSHTTKP